MTYRNSFPRPRIYPNPFTRREITQYVYHSLPHYYVDNFVVQSLSKNCLYSLISALRIVSHDGRSAVQDTAYFAKLMTRNFLETHAMANQLSLNSEMIPRLYVAFTYFLCNRELLINTCCGTAHGGRLDID